MSLPFNIMPQAPNELTDPNSGAITDANAIHKTTAGEIAALTEKVAPIGNDLIIIEDSDTANVKKKAKLANIPVIDSNAIHVQTAAEISAITEKVAPIGNDLLIIEDSAAANVKKKVKISNLPSSGITNTAPANTITKSDGVNLVTSLILDNGTTVSILNSPINFSTNGRAGFQINGSTITFGDWNNNGNATKLVISDINPGTIIPNKPLGHRISTVAQLPVAANYQGAIQFVSDATLTAITGLGLAVIGGGANFVLVYSDGANWIIL